MKMRTYSNQAGFMDKEGELSVLKAEGVYSMLFEYLFQDNKEDVELLLDTVQNKRFEDAVVDIVEACETFVNKK
jgi:N-acetylmuramoyl-L-alanine amidase